MENLLLIHGAIGSKAQLEPFEQAIASSFSVTNINLPGHGGTPMPKDFSINGFAEQIGLLLEEPTHIFGYSMGGYLGLLTAIKYPGKVKSVTTLATKFKWDPEEAEKEIKMLNPDHITEKLPSFASTLNKRHAPNDWKEVLLKTAGLLRMLGKDKLLDEQNLGSIKCRCRIAVGELDTMVTIDESRHAASMIPDAEVIVLAGTKHPIEKVNLELIKELVL